MKVTLNWLKKYVDFDWSSEELRERLTMLGLEVEGMHKLGGEFEGVVVAQVITRDKHPNADKLSLCRVADGKGERQIVCGAQNFNAGDKVPLILPGASLPLKPGEKEPFTIKIGKIRGIESHGMLCSPGELGLADDAQGLMILPPDAKVGQPFAQHLGHAAGDVLYDLEITPNRPDLNSVIGIAREISALTGNPLRIPEIKLREIGEPVGKSVNVRLDDPDLCARYNARVVRGVKVAPSPDWLKQALEAVGVRSISNVVDVTNFVMLEVGQPLHAFDYHLLGKGPAAVPTIVVRRAADGEEFNTLDGQQRSLTAQNLLIADETKAIALAGVMGGQNTEINEHTRDVLLESAWFKPQNIRATSKRLDLRTESSYRFERGADIGICDWASRRAAQLILETAGGELLNGAVDAFPAPPAPALITLRHAKTSQLLGVEIPAAESVSHLRRLGLDITNETADSVTVHVPSFRVDLKREVDLVEEVARLHGVDQIPSSSPRNALGSNAFDAACDEHADARRLLASLGLSEAQGQTLISLAAAKLLANSPVSLANPLSSDMDVLRPSLVPGLLDTLRHNVSRANSDLALFELGRVFNLDHGKLTETRNIALAITGLRQTPFWTGPDRDATCDVSDLKGILEEFLDHFGIRGVNYARHAAPSSPFVESASVQLGGKLDLGVLGQISPIVARRYDLRDPVFFAELNLDLLVARRNAAKSFKGLPAFPSVRRDVAMIVPESLTHEAVLNVVKKLKPANLERIELFDVFHGQNIPQGHKSMAYALTYRHAQRTLTDAEVNTAHDTVVAHLRQELNATIRD